MTRDQVEELVNRALKLNAQRAREICGVRSPNVPVEKLVGKCMRSVDRTWHLLRFCINRSAYPRCAFCGKPIRVSNPKNPVGLTKGHIISDANGGKKSVTNLAPEHLACNVAHKNLDLVMNNYRLGLSVEIHVEYDLGGKMNRNLRDSTNVRVNLATGSKNSYKKVQAKYCGNGRVR